MRQRRAIPEADGGEPLWSAQGWLHAETLESLAEVNEQCLELMCEQAVAARVPGDAPRELAGYAAAVRPAALLIELRPLWEELDAPARRRAARCPYLLVDAGLAEAERWARVLERQVQDEARPRGTRAFFAGPRAVGVMRLVVTYAWHLARSQSAAARLLLGMSAPCGRLIAACTLSQVSRLAETHVEWLKPRWAERVGVWRELLSAAISGEHAALERIRLRGVQLLAADARTMHL